MNKGELKVKRIVAFFMSFAIVSTIFANFTPVLGSGTTVQAESGKAYAVESYPPSSTTDYIAAKFDGITADNHIFDVVTFERLVKGVLGQNGKSIIILGSPKNESTKKTLQYINKAAKDFGIKKIYFFDPNFGGETGADITQLTTSANAPYYLKQSEANAPWKQLKSYVSSGADNLKGARLKYIDDDYTSDKTYLFVYDRNAPTPLADSADTIISDLLIDSTVNVSNSTAQSTFENTVKGVFTGAGWSSGASNETFYDQYHWFKSTAEGGAGVWTPDIPVTTYAKNANQFKIKNVTQPELINILNTPGEHYVFAVRSTCGDTRSLLPYVIENAKKANKPVYIFDITGWGSLPGSPWLVFSENGATAGINSSTITPDNPDYYKRWDRDWGTNASGLAYLNADIIEHLAPYNTGTDNPYLQYYPNGDNTQELKTTSARTFISPFLALYKKENNNSKGVTLKTLAHEPQEWEKPYKSKNDALAGQVEGEYVDYEVNTGGINELQAAKGRISIADFFGYGGVRKDSSLSNYYKPIKASDIDTNVNKDDNGCGDENDILNDVGGDHLLANQGTTDIDVLNYDINLDYNPTKLNAADAVTATTKVTAIVKKELSQISLDFKKLDVNTGGVLLTVNGIGQTVSEVKQNNNDGADLNKLIVNLQTPLAVGTEFVLTIPYTAGTIDYYVNNGSNAKGFFQRIDGTGIAAAGEPIGPTYWFPSNNTPADGAKFTITLNYPEGYEGVGPGIRTARTNSSATWKINRDTAPYQVFAAIGKFNVIGGTDYGYLRVSDDAEYAQSIPSGYNNASGPVSAIPYYNYINSSIYINNENRNRDRADTFTHELPLYIKTLEEIAGPYPGESAGFVFDNLSNGYGEPAGWGAIETKDRPFYTSPNLTPEKTFVHEYTHQWFGDAVRIASWEDLWLNEGFAAYVTDLYYEKSEGFDTQDKWKTLYNTTVASNPWWTYAPANIERESDMFGGAVSCYNRGGLALAALRAEIGDTKFFDILKGWVAAKKGQAVTTVDFIAFASTSSEKNLQSWANTWLYGQEKPAAWPTDILEKGTVITPIVNLDGGNPVTLPTAKVGDPIGLLPSPTKTGYKFEGWYVNGQKIDANFIVPGTSFILQARWTKDELNFKAVPVPTITGTVGVGKTLTAEVGTWNPKPVLRYQWYVGGKAVSGATKATYKIAKADLGKKIRVDVTAVLAGYKQLTKASKETAIVKAYFTKKPVPKITGTVKVGKTLKVRVGTWSPKPQFTYQWYANGKVIKGATKTSLKLKNTQKGKKITVKVTAKKANYFIVVKTSKATVKVKKQ